MGAAFLERPSRPPDAEIQPRSTRSPIAPGGPKRELRDVRFAPSRWPLGWLFSRKDGGNVPALGERRIPGSRSATAPDRLLPRGRHDLPREFVAHTQRDRLIDAM